jgi:hypothetical protein
VTILPQSGALEKLVTKKSYDPTHNDRRVDSGIPATHIMAPKTPSKQELDRRKAGKAFAKLGKPFLTGCAQNVGINAETVTNISSTDFPGHYPGEDHTWSLAKYKKVGSHDTEETFC